MGKRVPGKQQWIIWSGGLLAAWLLLLVPARAAESQNPAYQQTQISCASPDEYVEGPDCAPTGYHHEAIALASQRVGFSFLPSFVGLPWLVPTFFRVLPLEVPGRLQGSFFSFGFLRPIFEHQIAINAP